MRLELRFFASFREVVGQKILEWEHDADDRSVGAVLHELTKDYPDLELFGRPGELRDYVNIMKNGRDVDLLDGLDTRVEDGDKLSLFPPVAGG